MSQGKCNLLKPVDCATGTFFMFSQTAQDLTREFTQADAYRVVPSTFAALEINLSAIRTIGGITVDDSLTEKTLGQIFQNYFENACTYIRSALEKDGKVWRPDYSLPILWNTLSHFGLIDIQSKGDEYQYSDNLKYIGDINIYSYNPTQDGIGYSEIYCYIPNEATSSEYPMHYIKKIFDSFPIDPGEQNIQGYEGDASATYTGLHWLLDDPNIDLHYYDFGKSYSIAGCIPDKLNYFEEIGESRSSSTPRKTLGGDPLESFDFNTIVVMYDIVSKGTDGENDKVIFHNVPLGIYFTGKPDGNGLTNTVTKFVNNEDIYNQGTSYGLRICSRFLCSPNLTKLESVETTNDDYNAVFTEALSKMSENIDLFKDISVDINRLSGELLTHLANFRNNKVNVPYLRNLNGTYYWFVNGKNTGVPANSITKEEVDAMKTQMDRIEYTLESTIREMMDEMGAWFDPIPTSYIEEAERNFRNKLGLN